MSDRVKPTQRDLDKAALKYVAAMWEGAVTAIAAAQTVAATIQDPQMRAAAVDLMKE